VHSALLSWRVQNNPFCSMSFGNRQVDGFIVNPVHLPRRRRSNAAHEMAHLLLEHKFDCVPLSGGQGGCRNSAIGSPKRDAVPK